MLDKIMLVDREALEQWINDHYEALTASEWYEENFDGNTMMDITPRFFVDTYLIPLILSNIEYDFGILDAKRFL